MLKTKNQGQFVIAVLKVLELKVVSGLEYVHYFCLKTLNPAISDIFQLKILDKFHETDISMENLPIAIQDTFRHNFSD